MRVEGLLLGVLVAVCGFNIPVDILLPGGEVKQFGVFSSECLRLLLLDAKQHHVVRYAHQLVEDSIAFRFNLVLLLLDVLVEQVFTFLVDAH
jgi:hypothetical protein